MHLPMTAPTLLTDFARRGLTLRPVSGRLSVAPASALTATDREVIRERRDELLAALSRAESWDREVALGLMRDADALVERLGVDGQRTAVADAAATVTSAFATRDLETVRFAVTEFVTLVRRLAREPVIANVTGPTRANTAEKVPPAALGRRPVETAGTPRQETT